MSFVSLVFNLLGGGGTYIGAVQLDALLTEQSRLVANATSYTVEDGSQISDHIALLPEQLTLTGVITAASTMAFGIRGRSKLIASHALLRAMHEERYLLSVVTGVALYHDFALTEITITRDNGGDSLAVEAKLQKIVKAQLSTAAMPAGSVAPSAGGGNLTGGTGGSLAGTVQQRAGETAARAGAVSQATAPAMTATPIQSKSWLAGGVDAIGGWF